MSATQTALVQPHVLIQRQGARPGSLHAALQGAGGAWQTACGEALEDGPRGRIVPFSPEDAHAEIRKPHAPVCRRCDRVGDSVDQ